MSLAVIDRYPGNELNKSTACHDFSQPENDVRPCFELSYARASQITVGIAAFERPSDDPHGIQLGMQRWNTPRLD